MRSLVSMTMAIGVFVAVLFLTVMLPVGMVDGDVTCTDAGSVHNDRQEAGAASTQPSPTRWPPA